MAISALPSSGASISLQRTITTSGWVDLGDPKLIHFVLAGGGGGGGGGSSSSQGGGGGGGCGGAVAGKLFIGGRVYVHIGAGGTAGAANQSANNTRAGNGGNSYLGVPWTVSNDAAASAMYWIGGVGGMGGANGTTGSGSDAAQVNISLNTTGLPSITGYNSPNTVAIGCGPGAGGGGGNSGGNGSSSGAASTYYPNVGGSNSAAYALVLQGWANNDMRWFSSPNGTSVQQTYQGIVGINWTDFHAGNLFNPGSSTFGMPWTLWTNGNCASTGPVGGTGGTFANQPIGTNGAGGMFTGSGGGAGRESQQSGSGGGSNFNRGGESSRMFGGATDRGGGGGAGILRSGSDGVVAVNGTTGGVGGAGGLGGGGGGGGQSHTNGAVGGVGGQGALALFW